MNDIIQEINDFIDFFSEEVKAKKTPVDKKQYADKYYRKKKRDMKRKKEELENSVEGKKRKRMKPIMAKGRKTPTGRHKVSYNTKKE